MPEEQSFISGIQARYNHENTIPKTIEHENFPAISTGSGAAKMGGYPVFNNPSLKPMQQTRPVAPPMVKQATDPGEGIDHYKRLFSFT
mmetsp:Transcript_6242/g.8347  ORF Transcript_6242/g.8347 Transcript_6242/m.8347 type:complete len:88 (-) Transcript_6242:418-681(-)|eukprot:CAMPEP_0170471126 /NCGR_PEP_ID=MMETSP0123-20130129/13419_1 /TAXON_ID=182087 /ORGANISM="Favella ehrenbergii, Strain Fehren 1" /LENGTH=87 /DNA_ID=CAMNT_0010738609 /DNA_START=428 /DNA_END=691 /DNA_ORIENTATION=-